MMADFSLSALAGPGAGEAPAIARPESRRLRDLLRGVAEVAAGDDVTVTGLCLDSRAVQPGDLFFALPGGTHDGRDFTAQAVARGAVAVARESGGSGGSENLSVPQFDIDDLRAHVGRIAARFYGEPSARMRVIGVTGTNGKTTCAWLIAQALGGVGGAGERCALLSTVGGGFIDEELQLAKLTTADAPATQRALADFRARGADAVCVEASSHGLAQGRLGGIAFDVALLTNLSRDHLDYHRDMADYRAAKRALFECDGLGHAVINLDDDFGRELLGQHRAAECMTYAVDNAAADVCARGVESTVDGVAFEADFRGETAAVRAPLLGRVNAPNLLAAIAVGLCCGRGLGELAAAARHWRAPPGRMELLRRPGRPGVVIDYAHTPDALTRALASVAELCAGRLWLVFGCGGDRDRGKRPQMGRAAMAAARVIVTDDNPRFEAPARIAADIVAGMDAGAATVIHDRRAAIETAIAGAAEDDLVLVAGKGHERTQTGGGRVVEFSDRAVAAAALEAAR